MSDQLPEETQAPIQPVTQPAPQTPTVNWQEKYNGLQGAFGQVKSQHDKAVLDLNALREKYEGDTATLTQERDTINSNHELANTRIAQLEAENKKLVRRGEIRSVIAQRDSPELVSMYDQGLLLGVDGLEDEALSAHLDKLTEHLGSTQQKANDEKFAGSSPAPKGGGKQNVAMTADELYQKILETPYNTPERSALQARYTALLDQEG